MFYSPNGLFPGCILFTNFDSASLSTSHREEIQQEFSALNCSCNFEPARWRVFAGNYALARISTAKWMFLLAINAHSNFTVLLQEVKHAQRVLSDCNVGPSAEFFQFPITWVDGTHTIYPYTKGRCNSIGNSTRWKGHVSFAKPCCSCYSRQGSLLTITSLTRNFDFQSNRSSVLTPLQKRCYAYPRHRHNKLFNISNCTCTSPGRLPVRRRSQNHQCRFLRPLQMPKNAGLKVIAVEKKLWLTSQMISGLSIWHTYGTCCSALTNTPTVGFRDLD
jgi:hypothetical protein